MATIVFVLVGCGQNQKNEGQFEPPPGDIVSLVGSLKVGMTYEKVEKICGKPSAIERGFNQLANTPDGLKEASEAELDFIRAVVDTVRDANYWTTRKHVETAGQLIYVRWAYDKRHADTCFVWRRSVTTARENVPYEKYYINKKEVTKKEFDAAGSIEGKMSLTDHWETKMRIVSSRTYKEFYSVENKLCVLFDASSGRVVQYGFQPFYVLPAG
jgi:hypothetical protein